MAVCPDARDSMDWVSGCHSGQEMTMHVDEPRRKTVVVFGASSSSPALRPTRPPAPTRTMILLRRRGSEEGIVDRFNAVAGEGFVVRLLGLTVGCARAFVALGIEQ